MNFATVAQLEQRLGRTLTTTQRQQALAMIGEASAEVAGFCRQTIARVTAHEVTLAGCYATGLVLPERPVVEVTAVSIDGDALDSWTLTGDTLYRGATDDDDRFRLGWGGPGNAVALTYTHGYADIPPLITKTVIAMVVRTIANPTGVTSESMGQYSVTFGSYFTGSPCLIPAERRALRRAGFCARTPGISNP